ncbi:MAG TPA: PhnD/SsuA/transferrin family substrate-binding protein [Rudaea sp.]|nr:PhnD/SsuA/transferrin family substrate-binding protein [Rudaea sp.]
MPYATTRGPRMTGLVLAAICVFAAGSCNQAIAAEYTFRVEPAFPPDRLQEIYAPLMKYLDNATGQHFNLVAARTYRYYWRDITGGSKTDFAFDEAHLTDYRIQHQHFVPLVRTAEQTGYTLVANIDIGNKGLRALVGHTIVTMSAPSLGYSMLLEFYPNPVLEPNIKTTATSWRDAVDRVFAGEADAAMIPNSLKDQYPNLTPVKSTREFAGQCITASPDVPADVRDKVTQALLDLSSDTGASQVLLDLGISKFVPATAKEYAGDEQILKNELGYK